MTKFPFFFVCVNYYFKCAIPQSASFFLLKLLHTSKTHMTSPPGGVEDVFFRI